MTPLAASLLPPGVWGAQIEDTGQPVAPHPEEAHLVAGAAAQRARDVALGRACARAALAAAGGPGDAAIGRGPDGAPLWPAGFAGSITHTQDYAAALVARTADFSGLGIDAEQIGGVAQDLWPRLFDDGEQAWLASLDSPAQAQGAALLFSAKEACFKARPAGKSLAFRAIHIEVPQGLSGAVFVARQSGRADAPGRFVLGAVRVVTAVALSAR